jgi:predicted ATPase
MGNPFHVIQFMSMLRKEGLIRFNTSKDQWVFNIDEIQREMKNSDTLLEVLSRRIMHVSEEVQKVLKIASMIGFFFPESVFLPVVSAEIRRTESEAKDSKCLGGFSRALDLISEAMREGFIESADNGWQFAHDKLQASFQSSIEISEKRRLHGVLGNHYLFHRLTSDCICYAAFHLNKSYEYSKGCERVDKIARINLEAAKRCRDISAFTKATEWSRMGLAILNENSLGDKWTKNIKLTLELTEILAKMEFVTGNLESCKKLSQEAIQHCSSVDAKLNLLIINIEAHMLGHNKDGSINAVQRALREMGISLPRHINFITFRWKLRKVRSLLSKKNLDDLGGTGIMNNRRMATSVKWLVDLFSYCLIRDDEVLALYSALLATELTVKHGIFSFSTTAFVIYGIVEVFFGHADRARKCGELAMKILKKNNLKDRECSTVELKLSFISHWSMKLKTLVPILEDVMNGAVKSGDVIYGGFCLVHSFQFRFLSGESLKSLESNMRAHYSQIIDHGLDAMMWWSQPCLQFAINMRRSSSDWKELTTLSGEIMNEDDFTSKILASKLESMLIVLWTFKAYLAFNFGYFDLADEIYDKLKRQKILTNTSYIGPFYYFLGAMISFERYRDTKKRFFLRKARQNTEVMKRFYKAGNPNTVEFLAIMKAEGISIKSRDVMAITSAYSIAIEDCAKVGFVHLEVLAHERLSSELFGLRDYDQSKLHLNRAIEICDESWEATGKRDWLLSVEQNRFNPQ